MIVWIISHSFVFCTRRRASQHTENSSLSTDHIYLKGIRGLRWSQLSFYLSQLCIQWPPPLVIIVHVVGNVIGHLKTIILLFIELIFNALNSLFLFVLSFLFGDSSHLLWFSSTQLKLLEKVRRRNNRSPFICLMLGLIYSIWVFNLVWKWWQLLGRQNLFKTGLIGADLQFEVMIFARVL